MQQVLLINGVLLKRGTYTEIGALVERLLEVKGRPDTTHFKVLPVSEYEKKFN